MNSKVRTYIVDALAASGFVVIDHRLALTLREDLWASAANAYSDFCDARAKIERFVGSLARVSLVEIRFIDEETWLLTATRSENTLPDRVHWVTGLIVAAIRPFSPVRRAAEARERPAAEADGPPSHQCAARAEHFLNLGVPDPQLAKRPAARNHR